MAHTQHRAHPLPQPIVDIEEIDEALMWICLTAPRNENWHRWIDGLLDQRNTLTPQTKKENP